MNNCSEIYVVAIRKLATETNFVAITFLILKLVLKTKNIHFLLEHLKKYLNQRVYTLGQN